MNQTTKETKIKQVTTVAGDILVCVTESGDIYSTKLKGKDKGKWTAILLPKVYEPNYK